MNEPTLLINCTSLHTGTAFLKDHSLYIEGGKIIALGHARHLNTLYKPDLILNTDSKSTVIPGMIDLHIHGVDGADVMDGTEDALSHIAQALPSEGTTSFLATTMTMGREKIEQALMSVADYMQQQKGGAELLGVHLEGPFINKAKRGAQNELYIHPPDADLFHHYQMLSNHSILYITLAPELDLDGSLLQAIEDVPIRSIGHSSATAEESMQAICSGMNHGTHLFNGMSGIHHRDIGAAGAVLISDDVTVEVIVDGEHVSREAIMLAYRLKGPDQFILVTDSMRAKGLDDGEYNLGGQNIDVKGGIARTKSGSLAGSVLKMNKARQNFSDWVTSDLNILVKICSVTPARLAGVADRKGTIEAGKDADLTCLDENGEVKWTIAGGVIVYEREEAITR